MTHASTVFAIVRWLAGWMSVHHMPIVLLNG